MIDLKKISNKEIINLIKNKQIGVSDFIDSGICPTCFDKQNNYILYGNNSNKIIYEDLNFECFLVSNPRADGHTVISSKKHYKDILELDDDTCKYAFCLAKKVMKAIKEVYKAESVYLCTMCDGAINHFHIQLIPRYSYEKRGSKNFTKPRFEYKEDLEKIKELREKLKDIN